MKTLASRAPKPETKNSFSHGLGGTTSCLFKARSSSDVNMAGRDQSPTSTSNMSTKITDRNHNVESKRQHRSTRQTYRYGPEVNSSAQNNNPEAENETQTIKKMKINAAQCARV